MARTTLKIIFKFYTHEIEHLEAWEVHACTSVVILHNMCDVIIQKCV